MAGTGTVLKDYVRKAQLAIEDARGHLDRAAAWEQLQERDSDGQALGPLPYTEAALQAFERAHHANPEDAEILHHLAIAHHARAWDWELASDARAPREWEEALRWWNALTFKPEFWNALESRMKALDEEADPSIVRKEMREHLMENLLDVHVEFVRHYFEVGEPDRATAHIGVIQRAVLPPAVKKRLTQKVFHAMTDSISGAGDFQASGLIRIQSFLELFPDYLPALRMHAEFALRKLTGFSFQEHWAEILAFSEECSRWSQRLAAHSQANSDPLAVAALVELCGEFALRGRDRALQYIKVSENKVSSLNRDSAQSSLDLAIRWGEIGCHISSSDSLIRMAYAFALNLRAILLGEEQADIMHSPALDFETKLRVARTNAEQSVRLLEEAVRVNPADEVLKQNLHANRQELETLNRLLEQHGELNRGGGL